ncbi:hypothetical protein VNO78_23397 [Psophocarpus tetragonolobus]|uniref:DDE Tnp4 domain-containing protein n=1 Tax=Psophocarpus tetragonolobus TaxID=3891 RepID=A0AAN9XDZ3_PSOTE
MAKKRKAKKGVSVNVKREREREREREGEGEEVVALIWRVTQCAHSFLSHNKVSLLPSQSLRIKSLISTILSQPAQLDSCFRFRSLSLSLSDSQWLQAFRISKPSFSHLLHVLSPSLAPSFPHIAPDCVLASALFRLAHAAPYPAVSRRFSISPPEACRAFFAVCKALSLNLGHLFHLPTDSQRVVVGFGLSSLPNCFGVLGLASFNIDHSLFARLIVQALVDSEGRFLDVSAGWPSTMKPDSILRQSKLFHDVHESKELLNGPSYNLNDGALIPQYVLGDSCFPLLPWLLTPYNRVNEEDSFGSAERAFNSAHGNAMKLFRDAFGKLRATWRLLADSRKWKPECVHYLPFVVVAACLLHNFAVKCNEALPEEDVVQKEEPYPAFDGLGDQSGVRVRDALALHLSRMTFRK